MDPLREGHGKALHSENSAILIFGETMRLDFHVSNVEERRPKSSQTLNLGLQCPICFPVQTETPVWMKIMLQATCGEATRHARVSKGHALGIPSGDG
jgi:hypothetical protein